MSALPLLDQDANEPMLNNSPEQHLDNLTPEYSQPSQTELRSSEEKPSDALQLLFLDDRFLSIASIVGGVVVAVALAVVHHTFLQYLHGRDINQYPQFWIKGANNGFSNFFSIFVALSAGSALTQIKWRASSSEPLRTYTIDNLFALPAPLSLLKTIVHTRGTLFFAILSSVLIQALVLVSTLAPSALTVAPAEQVSRDIEVKIFDVASQAQFARAVFSNGPGLASLDLSAFGEERINSVLLNRQELTWAIPQDCGLKCAFYFKYNAPGLECHDVIPSDNQDPPPLNVQSIIYKADTNLYPPWNVTGSPSRQIDADAPYDLFINYTAYTNLFSPNRTSSKAGIYCRFYQATYNASFELNSGSSTQRASTSIISHGDYLSWGETNSTTRTDAWLASWAICYAFTLAFWGKIPLYNFFLTPYDHPVLAPIFNVDGPTISFELAVSDLSQTVVDLFSNLTLGLVSTQGSRDTIIANGTIWNGSSVWIYTTWILCAVYLPPVILAIAVALYGLYTIHLSGIAMDDKFSTFLLATRNAGLDKMCGEAADFEELEGIQLIHQNKGMFKVVDSDLRSPN